MLPAVRKRAELEYSIMFEWLSFERPKKLKYQWKLIKTFMVLSMVLVKNIEFYLWNENCTVLYGNRDTQILTKYLHNVMITIITPDCQLFFRQQCILVVYDPLLVQVSSSVTYWAFSLAILFYQIGRHLNCCKLTIFTHFVC